MGRRGTTSTASSTSGAPWSLSTQPVPPQAGEEGRITRSGSTYTYHYFLKDHLGNNRVGFSQGTNVTAPDFTADYYPFGLQYRQYVRVGNPKNNYLYNGKELQDGLKQYDYGARFYDPVIARFGTIDRFAEKYQSMTPYQYASLDPIKNIDVNGDSTWTTTREVRNGNNLTVYNTTHIQGKVLSSAMGTVSAKTLASSLNNRLNAQSDSKSFENANGGMTTYVYNIEANYQGVNSMDDVSKSDHLVVMIDKLTGFADPRLGGGPAYGVADIGGKVAYIQDGRGLDKMTNTAFHEIGHNLGLRHPGINNANDPMSYASQGSNFARMQMVNIYNAAKIGTPNRGENRMIMPSNQPYLQNYRSTNVLPYRGMIKPYLVIPKPIQN